MCTAPLEGCKCIYLDLIMGGFCRYNLKCPEGSIVFILQKLSEYQFIRVELKNTVKNGFKLPLKHILLLVVGICILGGHISFAEQLCVSFEVHT